MLTPADYDDIIVTVAHPSADIETTLRQWIRTGPGPRPFITIIAARRRNGQPVPLQAIPLEYRNTPKAGASSGWACSPHHGSHHPAGTLSSEPRVHQGAV